MVDFLRWNTVAFSDKLWYCHIGATDKRQAGGSPRVSRGLTSFCCPLTYRKGLRQMVTYSDMIQLGIRIVGIISLFIQVNNKKK